MQLEKRYLSLQIIIFISLIILPSNYLFKIIFNNKVLNIILNVLFIILLGISILIFIKGSRKVINIKNSSLNINKYLIYIFVISYIFLLIVNREDVLNIKTYFLLSLMYLSSIIGFIHNIILKVKSN